MCGIGGILLKRHGGRHDHDMAERLGASLTHRGRAENGAYADELISLRCARHAVIAIETAQQPLRDSAGEYVMIGNGEVLNYPELIATLPDERRRRLAPGDLQVALELFAARGDDGFEALRGPFALAVWQREREELTLVRDRLGERPLYYYETPDVFMFASEVRCLEAALRGGLTLDETSVLSFLGLGRMMRDRTMFQEIKSVPPGAVLRVRSGRSSWSRLAPISDLADGVTDDETVAALLDRANRRVLVADCPISIGFSGGIDSSVVLKAALEGADVSAVITVFSTVRPDLDENLRRSRAVAEVFGTELVEVPFTIPAFDDTVAVLNGTLDGPAAEPLVLHNDALVVAASEYAKVILGGHGADEVFGGYARYGALKASQGRPTTHEWMSTSLWERWNRTSGWKQFLDTLAGPEFVSRADPGLDALDRPAPYEFAEHDDPVLFGQALDLFRLMCWDMFRVGDENGMARSVEVRSPFFDLDLIAGAYALPVGRRVVPGAPKHLLHKVFEGSPLAGVFAGTKVGFDDAFSYSDWIIANWPAFSALITESPLATMGVLRGSVMDRLADLDWRLQWRLFALAAWLADHPGLAG